MDACTRDLKINVINHFEYAKSLEDWAVENDACSKYFHYRLNKKTKNMEWISLHDLEKEFIIKNKQLVFDFDDYDFACGCK